MLLAMPLHAMPLHAQWRQRAPQPHNVAYDGRFTFARIRYTELYSAGWSYDYPEMERNFTTLLSEITALKPHTTRSNILTFDDPELLKYPIAYVSEPGYWIPSDSEAAGLRRYVEKGGFVIFDDFMGREWENFETQFRRAFPNARIVPLDLSHPIFDCFFRIKSLDVPYPGRPYIRAKFFGVHEGNDPSKRLAVVINYDTDLGDYMEWTGRGWYPVDPTNEAYKLAVNYIVYGMTR
ncbi:MAG TPA: DUF4159 domain-containing protein [Gemmatimonadaceae bacterium]|nr:DUF4159 domain-containing protein [Gemmatimonadaceae bacterium]